MKKLPIALQVYSIRDEAAKDFVKAMKEVKNMGYDGVELAGLYNKTPQEVRDCLKTLGLNPISAHVSYQEFMEDLPVTVKRYATIGCKYLAIPYLMEDYRYGTDKFDEVMENIPKIAKECHLEGITLLYHNHDFEFAKTKEGNYVLDSMYEQFSGKVLQTELDTCWVKVAGEEPTEYIRKYEDRCPVIHLKDYVSTPSFDFRALGYGIQNIPEILTQVLASGSEWVVVEQDRHSKLTAMEDAELSIKYLKSIGW